MRSLAAGFRALGHGKLILLLAVATALLGLAAAVPLTFALERDLGGTLAGDHILRNHPTFAPTDVLDFAKDNASVLQGVASGSRYVLLLTILLQAFFAGGIVVVLGRGAFTFSQFFEPARRNFWHNVKCLFLFAVLATVVLGALLGGAFAADEELFAHAPPGDTTRWLWRWVVRILAVLVWGVISLLYDFARAARRYEPAIGAWRAWGFARRALRGSWTRGLILFLFWFVLGSAAWFASIGAAWAMPAASPLAIAFLMVLQFVTFLVRAAVRVAGWGSYLEFLDHRAAGALARTRAAHPVGDRFPNPAAAPF
jgi:hypothetical protein